MNKRNATLEAEVELFIQSSVQENGYSLEYMHDFAMILTDRLFSLRKDPANNKFAWKFEKNEDGVYVPIKQKPVIRKPGSKKRPAARKRKTVSV